MGRRAITDGRRRPAGGQPSRRGRLWGAAASGKDRHPLGGCQACVSRRGFGDHAQHRYGSSPGTGPERAAHPAVARRGFCSTWQRIRRGLSSSWSTPCRCAPWAPVSPYACATTAASTWRCVRVWWRFVAATGRRSGCRPGIDRVSQPTARSRPSASRSRPSERGMAWREGRLDLTGLTLEQAGCRVRSVRGPAYPDRRSRSGPDEGGGRL